MYNGLLYPPETPDPTYLRYCPDQGVWIHLRYFKEWGIDDDKIVQPLLGFSYETLLN
jgi:hypothetical protein